MSDSPTTTTPVRRRSQRDKKSVNYFAAEASTSTNRKRKRQGSDTENDATGVTDGEDAQEHGQDDDDDADDANAPKSKATRKGKAKVSPKTKGAPAAKKPRTNKGQPKTMGRRGRKVKEGDDAYDAEQVAKDTKIAADNPLFNAIMNPAAALQSTAEDFLESLEQSPAAAQAELINLVLRACGCNDTLNADEALDYDGVVDSLDNFTESLKQDNSPVYPLTSKLPVFKKFRKSLSEFIERLIASSAELGALYSSDLMATLQAWVIAMSSSQIRSFRHTATVVALEVETALCDVAAAVEKEAEVVGRQREGEKKRKSGKKGGNARDKELEGKAQEIRERRTKLAEFLKEFVDGVFVHRYRDLDPNIRAECVRAIGFWFRKYPGHFLDASYLRYVGWVLSDSHTLVRIEAVKALAGVYDQADYIASLSHFTERFKPRLLEMATSDTELSVRVAVIQVLGSLDSHSLLEEEEREKLCLLVFDEEPKVRRAVSQFVRGVWEEVVEERLVGRGKPSAEDTARAGVKALASLLVKWGKVLDKLVDDEEEGSDGGDPEGGEGVNGTSRRNNRRKEVVALVGAEQQGRIALAVEALWDEVEPISDWEGLLDLLLLDHSAVGEGNDGRPTPRARANGKKSGDEVVVDNIWRLEEIEESVLLQVLVAALRRAKAESSGAKKGEEDNVTNDITRALIKGLPRLFIKHQTDRNRIAEVLLMPTLMNLDLYLEMRMIAAYSSLWDDVIKQFTSHSSVTVLSHAMASIRHFMDATSLSNTNSTKILELEDELSSSLRDTVAGREEIEVATFTEDEVLALTAFCTRLTVLAGTRNMTAWIEEDEGGKQSSAWDILSALVERGRLGYKEEETMIEQALHVLTLHIIWKSKGLTVDNDPTSEEVRYKETLVEERDTLLEKLVEYAVGTQSNTVEGVKRAAFKHLLDLHVLFSDAQSLAADGSPLPLASVTLSLDDEIQYRCAGYIQAEIERYAEFLEGQEEGGEEEGDGSAGSSDEEGGGGEKVGNKEKEKKVKKVKKPRMEENKGFQALLEQEYLFIDVMSTFLRAIRAGAVNVQHGAILLAHYGRLGLAFDTCSKVIVEILREEGMMKDNAEIVITVVTQALQEAYTLVLDGVVHDESKALLLAKLLSSSFAIRGSQLSIVRRLDSQYIVQIHTQLLNWIGKKLAAYETNKNKKGLKTAVVFFKVMVPLFSIIQSQDALKIKAHMDQVLAQAKVEVSPTSKAWEPQRAYEKRLSTIMSKEKRSKSKKTGKGVKSAAAITSDEEGSEGEHADEVPPPRPKSRRPTRANPDPSPDRDADNDEPEPEPVTPKPKAQPRPRPIIKRKSQSPQKPPSSTTQKTPVRSRSPTVTTAASDAEDNDILIPAAVTPTPKSSRKRPRADDEEELGNIPNGVTTGDDAPSEEEGTPEIQVRRKRVRH